MKEILDTDNFSTLTNKLADSIAEKYADIESVVLIGIQQGGVVLADEIVAALQAHYPTKAISYGQLDITFYRDDIRNGILAPDIMHIPFSVEGKTVILIDDVLFTGRTIKAALDALIDLGRPEKIELCVLF